MCMATTAKPPYSSDRRRNTAASTIESTPPLRDMPTEGNGSERVTVCSASASAASASAPARRSRAPRRSPGASSSSRVSALSLPRASHTLPRVIHRLAEKLRAEESLHRDVHGMVEHRRRHFRVRVELVPLEYLVSLDVLLPLQVLQASQGGAPELRDEVRALGVRVHAFV